MVSKKNSSKKSRAQSADADAPAQQQKPSQQSFVGQEIQALLTGIMFFTRLPVPPWVNHDMYWMSLSTAYYPAIGIFVGYFGAISFYFSLAAWNPSIASVLYTLSTVWLTGAFHEDGLADTFDGFGGGWGRDQIMRIMRDSRIGTYGCVGLTLVVLAKLSAVASLVVLPGFTLRWLVLAHVLGRWSCLYLLWRHEYLEGVSAEGKEFKMHVPIARLLFGTVSTVGFAWVALNGDMWRLMTMGAVTVVATIVAGRYIVSMIGGVVGDCLGAANQVVELLTYLTLACDGEALVMAVAKGLHDIRFETRV